MSEPGKHDLLYVLEKVKAACSDRYGVFHTYKGSEDHEACLKLEEDGLIRCVEREDCGHCMWVYNG